MRIGTWNLAGRWTDSHRDLLMDADCDVWLLTEVRDDARLAGFDQHLTTAFMAPKRHWAGVFSSEPLHPLPDPHAASAFALVGGATYCSSILPWKGCGSGAPWVGDNHASKMSATLDELRPWLSSADLVWGGDWNQALVGPEYAGSLAGRRHLLGLIDELHLVAPTTDLPHKLEGIATIDHIALAEGRVVKTVERQNVGKLSDHDLYIVETVS